MLLFTLSLMIGTAGPPHVIMRFFTVPRVADACWSAGWALAFGLAAAAIFPSLTMGIFLPKIYNTGAVAGMLAGLTVTLLYIFLHKGRFFISDTKSVTDADPLLGTIKSTLFGAVGAAINFSVACVVSNSTKPLPEEIKDLMQSVRIACGAGSAQDH